MSIALGCGIALLPSLVFKKIVGANKVKSTPHQILGKFYLAAVLKFLSLAVLFFLVTRWSKLDAKMFFVAFFIMQLVCLGQKVVKYEH